MYLERQTGDLFRFDEQRRVWAPVGNVGVHCSLGAQSSQSDGAHPTGLNRSDGIGPCELTQRARFHPLFEEVWPAKLIVPESNEWHCHLPAFDNALHLPTGVCEMRVLATSRLGAQVVECRNAVALQFRPEERFPQTLRMLRNFVNSKMSLILGDTASNGVMPKRMLEMAAREPQHSDLVQQVIRSLAPPTSGPFAVRPAPTASRTGAGGGAKGAALGASGGGGSRGLGYSAAPNHREAPSRPSRPGSAGSAAGAGYNVRPSAALSYVRASQDALQAHAEQVHVGKAPQAVLGAELPGMGQELKLYVTKPPPPSSTGGGASRPPPKGGAAQAGGANAGGVLVPRVFSNDLVIDNLDAEELPQGAPPQGGVAEAQGKPRIVRIRRPSGKPFSNYQKYEAKRTALKGHTIHVTSVGPFISKYDQRMLDEGDARAKSIHEEAFKPGGLWDKWEAPPGGWGFAAAGFMLPDDLPQTQKRFGSFYNTHAHQFRYTAPKENLYM